MDKNLRHIIGPHGRSGCVGVQVGWL